MEMTLAEAKTVDLAVDDEAIATAEAEAEEAQELVEALERAAVEGKTKPATGAAAAEAKQLADFAAKRAARTRDLADRAKAARRVLALGQVADDANTVAQAATDTGPIVAAVKKIADGRAALDKLCAGHDEQVHALIARARELGAEPPSPSGPRATSAHVTVTPRTLTAGRTVVQVIGKRAAEAAALAAEGKPAEAIAHLTAARQQPEFRRAAHYYHAPGGHIVGADDPAMFADQLRKKMLRELTPSEVDAYLDGRLDGHQP